MALLLMKFDFCHVYSCQAIMCDYGQSWSVKWISFTRLFNVNCRVYFVKMGYWNRFNLWTRAVLSVGWILFVNCLLSLIILFEFSNKSMKYMRVRGENEPWWSYRAWNRWAKSAGDRQTGVIRLKEKDGMNDEVRSLEWRHPEGTNLS